MRVLLIEDDASVAQSIELMLKSESFNDLTGWLWTGLIERISQDRRSWT